MYIYIIKIKYIIILKFPLYIMSIYTHLILYKRSLIMSMHLLHIKGTSDNMTSASEA